MRHPMRFGSEGETEERIGATSPPSAKSTSEKLDDG
jgi:hypothetical protein